MTSSHKNEVIRPAMLPGETESDDYDQKALCDRAFRIYVSSLTASLS